MNTPRVQRYTFALALHAGRSSSEGARTLLRALRRHGITIVSSSPDVYLLKLSLTAALREAELMGLRMGTKGGGMLPFSAAAFERGGIFALPPPLESCGLANSGDLVAIAFSSGDRVRLLQHLLHRLTVAELVNPGESTLPPPFDHETDSAHSSALDVALKRRPRLVAAVFPLHCEAARRDLKLRLVYSGSPCCARARARDLDVHGSGLRSAREGGAGEGGAKGGAKGGSKGGAKGHHLDAIRSYFGVRIAWYFAFLRDYTAWLGGLALLGVCARLLLPRLLALRAQRTVDIAIAAFGGGGAVAWAFAFLKVWSRTQHSRALEWDVTSDDETGEVRVQWQATMGECEQQTRRVVASLATLIAIVAAGAVSFVAMHLGDDWVAAQRERPGTGAVADAVLGFVPTTVFVVVLAALDAAWAAAAPLLTHWENHETQGKHRWALVAKLALFQLLNNNGWLLYVVLVEQDVAKLRTYLYTVLLVKQLVLEQLLELGVPLLALARAHFRYRRRAPTKGEEEGEGECATAGSGARGAAEPRAGVTAGAHVGDGESAAMAAEESELCVYDVDDDFIELFVQFGRVVLFAAAMPIVAPLSAFANNVVEGRTDALKLLSASRRPRIESASGIGAWAFAFRCIAALAVVTNVALVITISLSGADCRGVGDTTGAALRGAPADCAGGRGAAEGEGDAIAAALWRLVQDHDIDRWCLVIFLLIVSVKASVSDVPQHVEKERLRAARAARTEVLKLKAVRAMQIRTKSVKTSHARATWRRWARAYNGGVL